MIKNSPPIRTIRISILLMSLSLVAFVPAWAVSKPLVFSERGQSQEQQAKDEKACHEKTAEEAGMDAEYIQTKIDTVNEELANEYVSQYTDGGLREVLGSKAEGEKADKSESDDDSDKGSGNGGILTSSKSESESEPGQEAEAADHKELMKEQAEMKQDLDKKYDEYVKSFSSCMEEKGYSVTQEQ